MIDIHPIKNFLYFFHYLSIETLYMLIIGIIIYVIYIIYLMVFEQIYKKKEMEREVVVPQISIYKKLQMLDVYDERFFEMLSLAIRSHLEDTSQVQFATKKTGHDIKHEAISHKLKEVLDICTYHEYTQQTASAEKKIEIIRQLRDVF